MKHRASSRLFVFCMILTLSGSRVAAQEATEGSIVKIEAYSFPSFQEAVESTDIELYAQREDYEQAVGDPDYELLIVTYQSDGLPVRCYLYQSKGALDSQPESAQARPTVVFNRGSYVRGDIAAELVTLFHRLAQRGFAVLAPLYRGSDGAPGRDEMGGADLNDLLNVVPLAQSLASVDAGHLFLYGESRGGMMVLQALREAFPARAAAVFGTFSDLQALVEGDPESYLAMARGIWPDFADRREEIIRRRSAVQWAEKIEVPLMILHGGDDQSIPPNQALQLAEKLDSLGKSFELVIYAGDNHVLSRHRVQRDQRVAEWFHEHMAPR
ncbi:MAG TPA: prolyl oligopeptidase family serine peptidase [Acidobacteriota bacterium]|nr:prolyl oligopeptidase family serine peptidase [Acidobacteriota bacterium]